jgi:four helix bundle protein
MIKFRFQDFEIWQQAIEIGDDLLDVADDLERKHLFKFSEQLRDAAMSISNNIAEGSGSTSNKEFNYFLNVARRSTFEDANILIILNRRKLISDERLWELLDRLDKECRMITNFRKTL